MGNFFRNVSQCGTQRSDQEDLFHEDDSEILQRIIRTTMGRRLPTPSLLQQQHTVSSSVPDAQAFDSDSHSLPQMQEKLKSNARKPKRRSQVKQHVRCIVSFFALDLGTLWCGITSSPPTLANTVSS
jgi:hypothetical protein